VSSPVQLSDELIEFAESGVSIMLGTCDAELRPETMRTGGALVAPDRQQVTTWVNAELAQRTLANLKLNPRIAMVFTRPVDHRSVQLKGEVVEIRPANEGERALSDRYLAGFVEQLYCVGMPRAVTRRLRFWPAFAITFVTTELFHQTPGPGAGQRLTP
jgi:Pyridoxamine 5'-phosphate oxidase